MHFSEQTYEYNDAGHSGKDLMRPEMQRLFKMN